MTDEALREVAERCGWQERTTAREAGLIYGGWFRQRFAELRRKKVEQEPELIKVPPPAPVAAPVAYPAVLLGDVGPCPACRKPRSGLNSHDLCNCVNVDALPPEVPAWQGYRPRDGWTAPEATTRARASREEVRRVAVIPDTHVPFHDRQAWAVALDVVREWRPHRVVLIGDFMDTESVSRHGKNAPDTVRLAEEFYETNLRLDELQSAAPDATWLYLEGNHEARISKWCAEFGNMDGLLDPAEALYMKPRDEGYHRSTSLLRGMEWIALSRQPYQIDGCAYLHGVYENMYHAAFHALHLGPEVGCKEIRFGHMHTLQSAISPAGYHAACVGFLGDKTQRAFKYKRGKPAPWALGLVLQEIGGGLVTDTQVRIVNGRALLGGRVIEARAA